MEMAAMFGVIISPENLTISTYFVRDSLLHLVVRRVLNDTYNIIYTGE